MRFIISAMILVLLAAAPLDAQQSPDIRLPPAIVRHSAEQWYTAIDDYIVHLRGVHPEPFAKIGRLEWLRAADNLKQSIPRLSEEQRMVRLMQLNALIGDGHTQLEPDRTDFGFWYPINLRQFPDGYFITSAYKTNADLAGAEILTIAGRPVEQVAALVRSLRGADNEFGNRLDIRMLDNAALMRGLGLADSSSRLSLTLRMPDGTIVARTLAPMAANADGFTANSSRFDWSDRAETYGPPIGEAKDWISAFGGATAAAFRIRDDRRPPHLTLRRSLVARNLPEAHAFYIQANIVEDNLDESFQHFFQRAFSEIDAAQPRNIILDLRNNEGGDGSRIPALIPLFAKHLRADQNLFLLTGPQTFSAAVLWLGDFINFLHPTIIGEPAGAALNSFGDAHEYAIKVIGASSHISTLRNVKSGVNDLSRQTPIDVPAPMTFADWRAGRDPAVDPILAGREMRGLAQIALSDGAMAARRAFAERQGQYEGFSWWMPPSEMELRRAVQLLTEGGRFEDAIAIGEISTKLHPDIWNSWYNLGQAQLEAGRLTEGQSNLAMVLKVDPDNFNYKELAEIAKRSPETVFSIPAILQWGATTSAVEVLAKQHCNSFQMRPITPPVPASVTRPQEHIDCHGFRYQGLARHLELVFRDGGLVMAWLGMRPADQVRVQAWIARDLDEAGVDHGAYIAFPKHMIAWRKDESALLFYSPRLEGEVSSLFGKP